MLIKEKWFRSALLSYIPYFKKFHPTLLIRPNVHEPLVIALTGVQCTNKYTIPLVFFWGREDNIHVHVNSPKITFTLTDVSF